MQLPAVDNAAVIDAEFVSEGSWAFELHVVGVYKLAVPLRVTVDDDRVQCTFDKATKVYSPVSTTVRLMSPSSFDSGLALGFTVGRGFESKEASGSESGFTVTIQSDKGLVARRRC